MLGGHNQCHPLPPCLNQSLVKGTGLQGLTPGFDTGLRSWEVIPEQNLNSINKEEIVTIGYLSTTLALLLC